MREKNGSVRQGERKPLKLALFFNKLSNVSAIKLDLSKMLSVLRFFFLFVLSIQYNIVGFVISEKVTMNEQ